jgi:DNA polymerase-3 subunit delta'
VQTCQRLRAGRLPHALLLSGPAGLGKLQFAQHFAATLLCKQPDEQGHACGTCKSCQLLAAGSHPDMHYVYAEEPGKAIKIDQIRELSDVMSRKPQLGGYRVCIVHPAESMNISAANALLKTLEEPGMESMIMLASSDPGKLTATIRSRCQQVDFHTPDIQQSKEWLKEQGVTDNFELLLSLANAAPLEALASAEDNRLQQRGEFIQQFLDLKTGIQNPMQMADKWYKNHPERCLQWMMYWVMDLIRLKSSQSTTRLINMDEKQHLQPMAKQLDLKNLFSYLDKLQQGARQLSTQVNVQFMMEDLFITWIKTR